MVQIKCLSNGIYSLKNSHIPFGQGFQPPPPPYGQRPFEPCFSYAGASLRTLFTSAFEADQRLLLIFRVWRFSNLLHMF